ncbi:hypothetical protein Tco_0447845 [Tanacetum coccineum]
MTSSLADESQNNPEKSQTQNVQQIVTTTISNNNAKFPYLKKDEYETWAMKMEYWIMNNDHNLWNVVLNGNSKKKLGRDLKGNLIILPPVSAEEQIVVQRETKARTLLLQSLPEDHMAEFHHLDDARDIWLAVKARFRGNEESKKMRKSMLKQEFQEFKVSEDEGLHKGYDRFQKILSQLNQLQAKPDNEDCNMKFLRALPSSWSQVAITLKAKGGLDYLNFDDLYNKLKSLEIDIKGGSSYKSNHSAAPSHSAFVSTTSGNNKMSYAETSKQSSSYISASPGSNVFILNSETSPQNPRTNDLPSVIQVTTHIPAGRQTGPAPVYAGTPVPAGRQNRPAPIFLLEKSYSGCYNKEWLVQEGTALGKDYIKSVNGCDDLPKIIRLASPRVNGYLVKASSNPFLFFDSPLPGVNTPWDVMRIECGASESAGVYVSSLHSQHICSYAHMLVKCFAAVPSQVLILKAKIYLET